MRLATLLVSAALLAGCATAPQQEKQGSSAAAMESAKDQSIAWGPCNASRATILASVSAGRAAALSRGFAWLDADVKFSETATHETYRTDCSGFVSMCWSLPAPGGNTRTLGTAGSGSYKLDSYDDLVPADALVEVGQHSVIFLGWNDSAHNGACVLEQSSSKNNMQFRVRMKSQLQGDNFIPMRSNEFQNDTTVYSPSQTPAPAPTTPDTTDTTGTGTTTTTTPDTDTSTDTNTGTDTDTTPPTTPPTIPTTTPAPTTPPPAPTTPTPKTPSTDDTSSTDTSTDTTWEVPVCRSASVLVVCAAAYATGTECGRVTDNCGRPVDCTGMLGFGCSEGSTCSANKCTSTCQPMNKADLCYSAQLKSGVQCGTIPDGCGGTVDCSDLSYFQCGDGTCGDNNKCVGQSPSSIVDHEKCEGSQDNPEVCHPTASTSTVVQGDPGDNESTVHTSSTRTTTSDNAPSDKADMLSGPPSSGCSSAPGGSSSGFGAVAIAALLMLGARRRRTGSC
jgi:MYXO-CTERM domain-containing protein